MAKNSKLSDWTKRANKVLSENRIGHSGKVKIRIEPTETAALDAFARDPLGVMAKVLTDFSTEVVQPYIDRELASVAGNYTKYLPMFTTQDGEEHPLKADYILSSFRQVLGTIPKFDVGSSGQGMVSITFGRGIDDIKLGGTSQYNTMFLAMEWGTGVAGNVGSGWVRSAGVTKDSSGDGSWWFGPRKQTRAEPGKEFLGERSGVHFTGQQGFHLFWDKSSRKPQPFWSKTVKAELGSFIGPRLNRYLRGRG